jgi:periplasmic copper chaperone A
MNWKLMTLIAAAGALALPAAASAHVTLQPEEAPAGGFTRLDVRVPNERDDAATEKVEVKMPDGFVFASYEPAAGWKVDVSMEKLADPVESHGSEIDEQLKTITWTATEPSAAIQPGQFRDFGLSVGMPESAAPGDELTFPSLQTYDSGEVVRWIGAPDSEEPAPQVLVTEPIQPEHGAAAGSEGAGESDVSAAGVSEDDDGAPTWLVVVALVVGLAGLATGAAALRSSRA